MTNSSLTSFSHKSSLPAVGMSRRRFLQSTAALLATYGLAGCAQTNRVRSSAWKDLAANLQGQVLLPEDASFAARATPWALRFADIQPTGIARCANAADVRTCVQWAQANGIPLVARSGGHSYGGFSTTTGLLIDVSLMNDVKLDNASGIAVLGGGARNRQVYAAGRSSNRAITHGRCRDVGVAGLVLGGGVGFNMRLHGLTCDQLLATQIVLADGRMLNCSDKENADLFWACRGAGGGNFGIHTSFTFATFPVSSLTVFHITWTERLGEVFSAVQKMTAAAPNALGMKLSVVAQKKDGATVMSLQILGQLAGPLEQLNSLLAPVLAVQKPAASAVKQVAYWDGQEFLSEDGTPEYAHERSRFVPGPLSDDAIGMILKQLAAWPGTSVAAQWKYFLLGGAVDARKSGDMAFIHRGHAMLSSIELEWSPSDSDAVVVANELWLSRFHEAMGRYSSDFSYQNFIDPSQENHLHAYYGDHLAQLRSIKRKYDPGNVFRYAQSIPV